MTEPDGLVAALADRYAIERELGAGKGAVGRYGSDRGRMAEIGVGR